MSTNQENKSAKVKKGALFALVVLAISSGFYFLYFEDTVENYSSSPVAFQNSKPEPGIAIQSDPNEYSVITEGPKFKILMPEKLEREKIEAPIINPPIPHLVQPAIATRVNANIGQNINTNHHSLISIPPRAFVDKNGNVVTGDVDVLYKEYYTPLDIFLSGIPMKYDSGANEQLVSAGMIEITAMKNNEPLYVNKENKINVMLASLSGDPDYSIYYYDTNKAKWEYRGKDIVSPTATGLTQKTREFSDTIETKFKYTEPEFSIELFSNTIMEEKRKNIFSKKSRPESFELKLNPKKDSPEENKFIRNIRWKYTGQDAFENYLMLVADPLGKHKYAVKKKWKEVKIEKSESVDTYYLKASNDTIKISLEVTPVIKTKSAELAFKKNFMAYSNARQKRENEQSVAFEKFQADSAAYYAQYGRYTVKSVNYTAAVSRAFQVDGFGLWNCDRPIMRPQGASVLAQFKDQYGRQLDVTCVYLVEKNSNTVFAYYPSNFKSLKYNPTSDNVMWTILPDGKFAYITAEDFKQYKTRGGPCVFKFTVDEVENPSRAYLKDKLKFS